MDEWPPTVHTSGSIVGFDGADETSLVVMHRSGDGRWRVETTDGPDAGDLARLAADVFQTHTRSPTRSPTRWAEQIDEWMAAHAGRTFELTDEQRDLLTRMYEKPLREGRLGHTGLNAPVRLT